MKIALINENSQCAKNEMIFNSLNKVATKYGHEVLNFGTYNTEDETQLTYVESGLLAAILLNTKAMFLINQKVHFCLLFSYMKTFQRRLLHSPR